MDASVVFSGETAEKRSGPADHMGVSVGEAEVETAHKLSSPPEHPRVTRLRHRRLIAFLRDQGFHDSYNEYAYMQASVQSKKLKSRTNQWLPSFFPNASAARSIQFGLTNKTRAHMSLWHLRGLVEQGRWLDAVEYLDRYLPPPTSPKSFRAHVLRHFLVMHHRFANAVAGIIDKSVPRNYLQLNNDRAISHADLRLRSISFSILAVDEVRANMNWETVRRKASLVVSRFAGSTPELRGCIELPATSIKPHHVLPIASGLRSRRRYVKKKQTGRTKAIIRALKSQRLMVPGIGSVEEAKELLADLLGAQFCQPMFGTSTEAKTSGTLANAGAQFCQPMFGTSTEAKTSWTLVNAGTNQHVVEAGSHTNTARQDLDGKRNSRDESTIAKLERELQRHRLTGTFRGACPVVSGPGAVVNLGAKLSGVSSE